MKLLDHHREHLRQSGLSDDTIERAGIYSVEDPSESARLLGWNGSEGPAPAIAFPVLVPVAPSLLAGTSAADSVKGTILRPDVPRVRADGSSPKYEQPRGTSPMLAFPPISMIPYAWWRDPKCPIVLTEGIKKALAIAQAGYPAIAAMGVDGWHNVAVRKAHNRLELHGDLVLLVNKDREFYIAFDGGDTSTNHGVINAEARLARMLLDCGARVTLVRVPAPSGEKVGVDDYLLNQAVPADALQGLLRDALPADPVQRSKPVTGTSMLDKAQMLLADPSFAAALIHAPKFAVDGCYGHLEKAKVSRAGLKAVMDGFTAALRSKPASPAAPVASGFCMTNVALRTHATKLLDQPDLLPQLLRHIEQQGLVGETLAAKALVLVAVSRRTQSPLHALVKGASGGGKNQVVKSVSDLLPPDDIFDLVDVSPRALQYLPENLDGKLIVIEEIEGGARAEYPIRIAMSKYELPFVAAQKVERDGASAIESTLRRISIRSSFVSTTTRARVHDENESRTLEITLDESPEQTARILNAQAERARRFLTEIELLTQRADVARWQMAFDLLEPLDVVVPDSEILRSRFDGRLVRHRRDLPRALGLARAVALLYQRQRQRRGAVLVAERSDVEIAVDIIQRLGVRESPRISSIMATLEKAFGNKVFSSADAATELGYARQAANRILRELEDEGLVDVVSAAKGNRSANWQISLGASGPAPLNFRSTAQTQFAPLPSQPVSIPKPLPFPAPAVATATNVTRPQHPTTSGPGPAAPVTNVLHTAPDASGDSSVDMGFA